MAAKKISNVVAADATDATATDAIVDTASASASASGGAVKVKADKADKAVKTVKAKKGAAASASAATATSEVVDAALAASADGADTTIAAPTAVVVNPSIITLDNILKSFASLTTSFKDISAQLKVFQKEHNKMARSQKGKGRSAVNASGQKRKPSGFAKPAKLTDELCAFLNLPIGSEEPRMVVTSKLNTYIVENSLQRPENRKFINANKELKDLLHLTEGIELSYFNLQKHMRHLFVPNVPTAATAGGVPIETIIAPVAVAVA